MKEQHKLFSTDQKMDMLAPVHAHMVTQEYLAAMLGLSVLTLNTTVSKRSETEQGYLCCGKERAPYAAAHLDINGFWVSHSWIDCFKKRHNLTYKTVSGESASINPATAMDWKS